MNSKLAICGVLLAVGVAHAIDLNLCTAAARKEQCPPSAPFFGFMGCAAALVFACLGAAYGTAKSGVGVANMGVLHPDVVMKSIIPVVMAGVLGIYGIILILIFAEALGLYGLIVALILQSNKLECIDVSSSYFVTSDGTTTADTNCLG